MLVSIEDDLEISTYFTSNYLSFGWNPKYAVWNK